MFFKLFINAAGNDQIRAKFACKLVSQCFSSLLQFTKSIKYPGNIGEKSYTRKGSLRSLQKARKEKTAKLSQP